MRRQGANENGRLCSGHRLLFGGGAGEEGDQAPVGLGRHQLQLPNQMGGLVYTCFRIKPGDHQRAPSLLWLRGQLLPLPHDGTGLFEWRDRVAGPID